MGSTSIIATVGSLLAGGIVAVLTIVGLVSSQTSAGESPTDATKPVTINYGTR